MNPAKAALIDERNKILTCWWYFLDWEKCQRLRWINNAIDDIEVEEYYNSQWVKEVNRLRAEGLRWVRRTEPREGE